MTSEGEFGDKCPQWVPHTSHCSASGSGRPRATVSIRSVATKTPGDRIESWGTADRGTAAATGGSRQSLLSSGSGTADADSCADVARVWAPEPRNSQCLPCDLPTDLGFHTMNRITEER